MNNLRCTTAYILRIVHLVLLLIVLTGLPATSQADINDGLIAHYTLDGTSGVVVDSAGSHDGINFGAVRGVAGKVGNAFQFDGYDDYVDTLSVGDIPTTSTISLWMYPTQEDELGQIFGSVANASGGKDGITLNYDGFDECVNVRYYQNNVLPGSIRTSSDESFPLNTWSHLTYTWDSSNDVRLYANGNLTATGNFALPPSSHDRTLMFGKSILSQNLAFDGLIDDVKIWDRALSASEVASLSVPEPSTHVLSIGVHDNTLLGDLRGDTTAANVGAAFAGFQNVDTVLTIPLSDEDSGNVSTVRVAVETMEQQVVKPGDTFVFYIGTHGLYQDNGDESGVLAQTGGDSESPGSKWTTGDEALWLAEETNDPNAFISDDDLHNWFDTPEWDQVNKLFIIDACFSGGFWGGDANGDTGDLATLPQTALIAAATEEDYAVGVVKFPDTNVYPPIGYVLDDALDGLRGETQVSFADLTQAIRDQVALFAGTPGAIIALSDVEDAWSTDAPMDGVVLTFATEDFQLGFVNPIPEPSSLVVLGMGAIALLAYSLRRRRTNVTTRELEPGVGVSIAN